MSCGAIGKATFCLAPNQMALAPECGPSLRGCCIVTRALGRCPASGLRSHWPPGILLDQGSEGLGGQGLQEGGEVLRVVMYEGVRSPAWRHMDRGEAHAMGDAQVAGFILKHSAFGGI